MTQRQSGQNGGRLSDLARDVLEESPDAARAYLRETWLSAAIRALRDARRKANLTQEEVAEHMGTTQPAIARLENDHEGRTTLHRYADYAVACGMLPLDVVLAPIARVCHFAIGKARSERVQSRYGDWAEWQSTVGKAEITHQGENIVTTKEELHRIVETLADEDAAELLQYAQWLLEEEETISQEDLARARRAVEQIRRGEYVTLDQIKRHHKSGI